MSIAGSAGSGGFTYQHLTYAYISVYVLAGEALRWFGSDAALTPVALRSEGPGSGGDDLHVEIGNGGLTLLIQAKGRLKGGADLRDTVIAVLRDIVAKPGSKGILAYGPPTSAPARLLKTDLERLRRGHSDGLRRVTKELMDACESQQLRDALRRLYLVELSLEGDSAPHRQEAEEKLGRLFELYEQRHVGWSVLAGRGAEATQQRSGDTRGSLNILLANSRIGMRVGEKLAAIATPMGGTALSVGPASSAPSLAGANWRQNAPAHEVSLHTKIDTAKSLLEADAPIAALHMLDEVLHSLGALPPLDALIHVRLHNNRGVAFLSLARLEEADREFLSALDFAPEDLNATSNRGAVAIRQKEYERALSLSKSVLERNPRHSGGLAVRLEARARLGKPAVVPPEAMEIESVRLTMGMLALERRDWEIAEGEGQAALVLGNRSASALILVATARLGRLGAIYQDSPDAKEALRGIARLAHEAQELLSRAEGDASWCLEQAVTLEAIAERLLGNAEGARELLERMLHRNPSAQRTAGLLAFVEAEEFNNASRALELLERAARIGPLEPEAEILRARVLYDVGRQDDARTAAEAAIEGLRRQGELGIWGGAAVEAAIAVGAHSVASTLLLERGALGLPAWVMSLFRARLAAAQNNGQESELFYLEAVAAAPPVRQSDIRRELGASFHRTAKWEQALDQYRQAGLDAADDASMFRYAHALFQARLLSELDDYLTQLKTKGAGELPRWALQFEAQLANLADDLPRQVLALGTMATLWPERVDILTSLSGALARLGRMDEAQEAAQRAQRVARDSAEEWTAIARVFARVGDHEAALEAAYRAVRLSGEAATQCELYVLLFIRLEQHGPASALLVSGKTKAGTVVTLQEVGDNQQYSVRLIEEWEREDSEAIRASDSVSATLLDKSIDEVVLLERAQTSGRRLRIVEVKSIYVWQFQRIFQGVGHPLAPQGFSRIALPTGEWAVGDWGKIIEPLAERTRLAEVMFKLHRDNLVPLGIIAKVMKVNLATLYAGYTSLGYRLEVETGDPALYHNAIVRFSKGDGVVLTRSFIETADRLGLLPLIKAAHSRLVVPQSLCDELKGEVEEERAYEASGGQKSIALVNGALSIQSGTTEASRVEGERLARLESWVRSNCEVLARPTATTTAEGEEWRQRIGAMSADSLLLASHHGLVLLADDVGLRLYSFSGHERVDGCSTAPWIRFVGAQGLMEGDVRSHLIAQLLRLRHHFVSVDAQDVMEALRRSAYAMEGDVLALLDSLRDPVINRESAAHLIATVARAIAIDALGAFALRPFLRVAVDAMADGRTEREWREPLVGALASALALLPQARQAAADVMADKLAALGLIG